MATKKNTYRFETTLAPIEAVFLKTAIFLPAEIIRRLPKGRVRAEGTFNGVPFALAVQRLRDGSRYFSVSAPLRRAAKMKKIGDPVSVSFKVVDPDKLHLPEELQAVLDQDPLAMTAWEKLTVGYQRGLIHYVNAVKNVDSRIKRSIALLERAKSGRFHTQKKPAKPDSSRDER